MLNCHHPLHFSHNRADNKQKITHANKHTTLVGYSLIAGWVPILLMALEFTTNCGLFATLLGICYA